MAAIKNWNAILPLLNQLVGTFLQTLTTDAADKAQILALSELSKSQALEIIKKGQKISELKEQQSVLDSETEKWLAQVQEFTAKVGAAQAGAVVEPIEDVVVEPIEDVVVEPIEDVVVEPIEDVVVEPIEDVVVEPIEDVVVEPVADSSDSE
jgi:hypothetical protein